MKLSSTTSMVLLGVAVFALLVGYAVYQNYAPSVYDDFAQCLTDEGVQIYGAYWCPNCLDQKEMFGSSWRHIDYIECSSQGSNTFDLCPEIETVPLWVGAEGTESLSGRQDLDVLAETYDCALPEQI